MKEMFVSTVMCILLFVTVFGIFGCSANHLGETKAEVRRRHIRISRINKQALMEDIDVVLQLDRPSRLADKKIP